jgi:transitional endoplasmic reticulum ATPase
MNAPYRPSHTTAHVGNAGASGMRVALECARNVYEAVDRRMPEAAALANWLGQSATALGLPDPVMPDDDAFRLSRRRGIPAPVWRKIGPALTLADAALPGNMTTPADRWIAVIAESLSLDPLETRILALGLYYKLDKRVDRLFDAISECRGGVSRFHRDTGLFALLLQAAPADIERRLRGDAKLRACGLLHLDQDGELHVLERLVALIRQNTFPETDFYDQLLGAIAADPLPWESFEHLGREAEVVASVLKAALARRESGINILLYGPPGTGKTSFAATLAAHIGARLRPVAEADENGGEPSRHERLAELRLAQRLAVPGSTLLLFDEAEDLFVRGSSGGFDEAPAASSRVFIHRLLERVAAPVIWTANDIGVLGPAVLRRMTMCLELKVPNVMTRARLWRRMGDTGGRRRAPCRDGTRGTCRCLSGAPGDAARRRRGRNGAAGRRRCRPRRARRSPPGS